MKIWKVILAAVVIFVAGFVTGGLSVKLSRYGESQSPRRSPGSGGPRMPMGPERQVADLIRRMESRLDLTEAQNARIREIVVEGQVRMRATWKELAPRMRSDFTAINDQIREVLTPDQREKFEELTRHRHHGPRPEGYKRGESGGRGGERRTRRSPDASVPPPGPDAEAEAEAAPDGSAPGKPGPEGD